MFNFTVTFYQFNVSLNKNSIHFLKKRNEIPELKLLNDSVYNFVFIFIL